MPHLPAKADPADQVSQANEAVGGVVFRRTRGEIVDAQIERDVMALKAEIAELEVELNQADGEAKAKLQAKIDAAQATQDSIRAKTEASKQETEAKIKSLQEQSAKARGERKAKMEARIAELKASQKRRSDLLHPAWELTKEAMKI